MDKLEQGRVYNLYTKAPGILGGRLENASLGAIMTYDYARTMDNIDLLYRQVYPTLPAGTPDNVRSCTYYVFKLPSGGTKVLADQWIDMSSVELVDGIEYTVTFRNKSISHASRLRDILNSMGETDYVIRIKT